MRIFTQEIIVAPQHIDIQNRVSNLCHVQWMQDLAINHSTVGLGRGTLRKRKGNAVVRQHTITYKRLPLAGDVTAATWVAACLPPEPAPLSVLGAADRSVWPKRATVWVYIDMATGPAFPPRRLPAIGLRGRGRRQGSFAAPAGLAITKDKSACFQYISPALLSMTELDRPLHAEPRKKTGDHLRPFPVGRSQKREADGSPPFVMAGWLHTGCEPLGRCDASAQISIGTGQIAVDAVTFAEALLGLRVADEIKGIPQSEDVARIRVDVHGAGIVAHGQHTALGLIADAAFHQALACSCPRMV